jgi:AcrR family transcriptional regulator
MSLQPKVNAPKQDRSRRTLDRIVRASIEILEEQGGSGLTVQAIIKRAGASVGSFYARFAGKDDLVDYLGERVWREAAERWDRALAEEDWSRLDLPAVVRAAVRLIDRSLRSRATILEALGSVSGTGESAFRAFQDHVLVGLEKLLTERAADIAHSDPVLASRIGLRAVQGALSAPTGVRSKLTEAVRAREAERLLLGYLTGQTSTDQPESGAGMDFFDIWG